MKNKIAYNNGVEAYVKFGLNAINPYKQGTTEHNWWNAGFTETVEAHYEAYYEAYYADFYEDDKF